MNKKSPMSALSTFLVISPSWLEFRWSSMLQSILFAKDLSMCSNLSRLSVMHLIFKYVQMNCISESVDYLLACRRSQSCLSERFHLSSKISICINIMQFWVLTCKCSNLLQKCGSTKTFRFRFCFNSPMWEVQKTETETKQKGNYSELPQSLINHFGEYNV